MNTPSDRLRLHPVTDHEAGHTCIEIDPQDGRMIGRAEDGWLAHPSISRQHARISHQDGSWTLVDTRSTSGTWLNTVRLDSDDPAPLNPGDLIAFGQVECVVEGGASIPAAPPSPKTEHTNDVTQTEFIVALNAEDSEDREEAWWIFDARYRNLLERYLRSRGCRDHDIADMCQDVFVSLISALKGFTYDRSRGRFRGYLLRCVQHALAKKMGRDTRAPALLEVWDPPAEEDPVWHAIWRQEYVIDLMRQARGQFDGKTLTAFERHGRAGEASQTVAKDLEMTPEAVRQAKHRVAAWLRTRLDHE